MILPLLKKDWLLLWPLVLLVTAIQAALQWATFTAGLFGDSAVALELLRPLNLAWVIGIAAVTVAVVQQDPVPGADLDWLIRPLRRRDVLLSKCLFVVLTLVLPMFVLDLAQAAMMGFSLAAAAPALLFKEMFLFAFFMLPVLALASTTRTMAELLLLGAALMVIYVVGAGASALVLREDRCPTCDTGFSWLQHFAQHTGIFLGSLVILALQYSRRRTGTARAIALLGAAALAFAQVPWTAALALQRQFLATPSAVNAVMLTPVGPQGSASEAAPPGAGASRDAPHRDRGAGIDGSTAAQGLERGVSRDAGTRAPPSRQATRALLHGEVDEAIDALRRGVQRPSRLEVPLQVSGVGEAQMLLVDRVEVESTDRLRYTLTLMTVVAEHRLTVADTFRSTEIGLCASRVEDDHVAIRCKQVGHAPFCYGATLFAADGSHNPQVTKCWPDYRPYGAVTSALSFFGVDLPIRDRFGLAHYPVDQAKLPGAYVVIRVYAEADHFQRVVIDEAALPAGRPVARAPDS